MIRPLSIFLVVSSAAACATALPPEDLITARATYARASAGPAAALDPADMHTAAESLQMAETSFDKNGDTPGTRDLAYVADRRAQIAEARSGAIAANGQQQDTLNNMHAAETSALATTSGQLGQANAQIALQGQALATETQRRKEADARAAKAAADLAAFASVKQETRGMVITLSGAVLFASNKWELLPSAQAKLGEVAQALTQQDGQSKIIVEGHTDSQGGASFNQDLSQRRAQAVRDYLVTRGMAADRITSQGFGLTRPIADNGTAEGRADNRRVEIIVQPGSTASR
jgi:outer membrane protein OmpA-like peptidoglycan-associated protein